MSTIQIFVLMYKRIRIPRYSRNPKIPSRYSNQYQKKEHTEKIHKDLPPYMQCPCESKSCLISRRWLGELCYEDNVFKRENIPLRRSCMDKYTIMQEIALKNDLKHNTCVFWDNSHIWNKN